MIKANELRWGNWVYDTRTVGDRTGLPKVLHPIMVEAINQPEFRYCDPIPLTPEILEKAGFVSNGISNLCLPDIGSEWEVCKMKYGYVVSHESSDPRLWNIPVNYLHQLQNLYFALTGEELIINL